MLDALLFEDLRALVLLLRDALRDRGHVVDALDLALAGVLVVGLELLLALAVLQVVLFAFALLTDETLALLELEELLFLLELLQDVLLALLPLHLQATLPVNANLG